MHADSVRAPDLTPLLEHIIRHAAHLLESTAGVVYLWDEAAALLIHQVSYGLGGWRDGQPIQLGEHVAGTVAQRRQGVVINDYRTSPYANPPERAQTQIAVALAEPLLYRNQLLGVIMLGRPDAAHPFMAEEQELLALFASQGAIAIQNARLNEETARRQREADIIAELARDINASPDLATVLQRVAEGARELCQSDAASIALRDAETAAMIVRSSSTPTRLKLVKASGGRSCALATRAVQPAILMTHGSAKIMWSGSVPRVLSLLSRYLFASAGAWKAYYMPRIVRRVPLPTRMKPFSYVLPPRLPWPLRMPGSLPVNGDNGSNSKPLWRSIAKLPVN
jgi:transcriptional regulator with GAF, ATPase, and Fis domain